jgi:hypothetical protein
LFCRYVRISQEIHLEASAVCYGDSFNFLYVDNVRSSQETRLWSSSTCYSDSFAFLYVDDVRTSQETPIGFHDLLRATFTFLYVDDVRALQEARLWLSPVCYGNSFFHFGWDGHEVYRHTRIFSVAE